MNSYIAPRLAALLGSFEVNDFFENHWPHTSLVCHAPLGRFTEWANAPELANLEALLASISGPVRVWSTDATGRFSDETLPADAALLQYQAGTATVVIDSLESRSSIAFLAPFLDGLASDLVTPQTAIACNVYASRAGMRTVSHFDEQEVFLLQIRGEKRWMIAPNREIPFPTQHYNATSGVLADELLLLANNPPKPNEEDQKSVVLQPGSVLFLPRGYWHQGVALTDSLAFTLTFNSATWLDLLLKTLRRRLLRHELLRMPAVGVFGGDAEKASARPRLESAINTAIEEVRALSARDLLTARAEGMDFTRRFSWVRSVLSISFEEIPAEGRNILSIQRDTLPEIQVELQEYLTPLARWLSGRPRTFTLLDAIEIVPKIPREDAAALLGLLLREEVVENSD